MIHLTIGVAISDEHARFTRLETDAPLLAAVGTAVDRIDKKVHGLTRSDTALVVVKRKNTCI
jgi:hypothetical protein